MLRIEEVYLNHFTKEEIANDAFNDQIEDYLYRDKYDDTQYYINQYSVIHFKDTYLDNGWSLSWLMEGVNTSYNFAVNTVIDNDENKVLILMTRKGEYYSHIELMKVTKDDYYDACEVIDDCLDDDTKKKYKQEIEFVKKRINKGWCNSFVAYLLGDDQSDLEEYILEIYEKYADKNDILFD
jgi:hypothetical protein